MRTSLLCALLLCGACAPLRRTRTDLDLHAVRHDTAFVRLLRREFDRGEGLLEQTVTEFYPPTHGYGPGPDTAATDLLPAEHADRAAIIPSALSASPADGGVPGGPLRRIVRTTLRLQRDRTIRSDSLGSTAAAVSSRTEQHERRTEHPSDATQRLRWLALLAAACTALVLFRRR